LDVTENFTGAMSSEFTLHLTSDAFLGSIPQGVPLSGKVKPGSSKLFIIPTLSRG
jgi:hypothetical protein